MKAHPFTGTSLRTEANNQATFACMHHKAAGEADKNAQYFNHKLEIMRNFLLNSPWLLYTIMYFSLLIIDAIFMRPIIGVVVAHGFLLKGPFYLVLFVIIYVVLVSALTIGAAYGFAKMFDAKLRSLQVELDTISRPGVARTIIMGAVLADEKRDRNLGVFFTVLLVILLVSLSLYRNYLTNDFTISFITPADWLNLILPISIAAALVFFGIYKDTLVRKLYFENRRKYFEGLSTGNLLKSKQYSRQAIEQEYEARKNNEDSEMSADLKQVFIWYKDIPTSNPNYFEYEKCVTIQILNKGILIPGIQVIALTGDDSSIFKTTGDDGIAKLSWRSESDFIKSIRIGKNELPGKRWFDGQSIKIDLTEIFLLDFKDDHQPKLEASHDIENP